MSETFHPEISARLLGDSQAMVELKSALTRLATTTAPVLLRGERGTGKQSAARALHAASGRTGPFVIVDCSGMRTEFLELELFGQHHSSQRGRIECAAGGTLFLDEIGAMPEKLQARLSHVLEKGTFRRAGSHQEIAVDFRFVAATHELYETALAHGRLGDDLLFRMNLHEIHMPRLVERAHDIRMLVQSMLENHAQRQFDQPRGSFDETALELLARQEWPGNLDDLYKVVSRALTLFPGREIGAAHLLQIIGPGSLAPGAQPRSLPDAHVPTQHFLSR
ncbi:sigma-54 interacting transcriptional regulator [Rhodovulum bhavnagarense]|uniref:Sigma-54 interacting transcriptional regulator n=1 Tax=Rhodovulum bhavnagarense TaxID=992286 RepID=A0A4R2RD03_9RHOB|nr:sigma 54-interacting transcriptional regulator [Rhodovulum bhavnagarense]TCP61310.1 sigma-54 interacting transcriptional regulator [Rhodovulum bhavnagarense]